ncbi:hypothetical protein [Acetanaerobacterium elongatum]|uniref:Uncharacterized protein n=1 Tax=Acetanaerobacterium elongatum TaxID=258515 RepID=A0A1H0ELH2_9FIRM|nr:hypothetical protein [Acetanaerobacterium elongatum]SDN83268.1 hypothetical protein SAMN05192585_13426 [Acetanaerobacterium elongatum]
MGFFDEFKAKLVSCLQASAALCGVAVLEEYPALERESLLKQPCLCVGLYEIVSEAGGSQYLGTQSGGEDVFGKGVTVTVSFKVYTPLKQGGSACHRVFSALAQCLLLGQNAIRVQSIRCKEVSCDRALGAFTLTAYAQIKATVVSADDTQTAIEEIEVKRRENG